MLHVPRAPVRLGEILQDLLAQAVADLGVRSVRAGNLKCGDVIPSWPDGKVTQYPFIDGDGRIHLEINGVEANIDTDECVEILRWYCVALPDSFMRATRLCYPNGLPAPLDALGARSMSHRIFALSMNYAELEQLADLGSLVWWECIQADGDPSTTAFADAARMVAQGQAPTWELAT